MPRSTRARLMVLAALLVTAVVVAGARVGLPPSSSPDALLMGVPYAMTVYCPVSVDIAGTHWQFAQTGTPEWPPSAYSKIYVQSLEAHGTFTKRSEELAVFAFEGKEWLLHRIPYQGNNPCV